MEMPIRRDARSSSDTAQLADLRAQVSKLIGGKVEPAASELADVTAAPVRGALDYLPLVIQYAGPIIQLFHKARSKTQDAGAKTIGNVRQQRSMLAGTMAVMRRFVTLAMAVGVTYGVYRLTRTAQTERGTRRARR